MKPIQAKQKSLFVLVSIWMFGLCFFALQPESIVLFFLRNPAFFSPAHALAYGGLAFLLCLYLRFRREFFSFRMNLPAVLISAMILSAFCGGFTEILQIFSIDRIPDWLDFGFDLIGAVAGCLSFAFFANMARPLKPVPALSRKAVSKPAFLLK